MKNKAVTIIVWAALALCAAVLGVTTGVKCRTVKRLDRRIAEQSKVIDSLLAKPFNSTAIQLHVNDRSRNIVRGKGNRGTIVSVQDKVYRLEIDSVILK